MKTNQLTLAEGEKSGHHHVLYGDIDVMENTPDNKVFKVNGGKLTHPEHDMTIFDDEMISSAIQIESDPFSKIVRKVLD